MNDRRRDWCEALANAVSPSFPVPAYQALEAMLPFLDDFPDFFFCRDTIRAVACAERRQIIPSLGEIVAVFKARRLAMLPPGDPAPKAARITFEDAPPTPEQREASLAMARQVMAELRAQSKPLPY